MSTLVENIQKVKNAHAALKQVIAAKGVTVPDGTKLTGMPALVNQIQTMPEPTNQKASFAGDGSTSIVVPTTMVVDMIGMTDLRYCFYGCDSLTQLSLPDGFGQNALHLGGCFASCRSLTTLVLPDGFGQNAEYLSIFPNGCFSGCRTLTSLHLPTGFGQHSMNNNNCFYGCSKLADITGNPQFKSNLNLQHAANLTHDSLMVVINGLQTVTETQTLTLGKEHLAKLTDAEKQIATDKGWTLA